ncbi:AAA family ATPase [Pseudalkalibacillus decolorationis]|uniref:AAA family ATPase n=1 Tax=Pseudalkalibacillus decolorationis TaxID=163879 RepID=UPI00214845A4|nr:AAA family ATPase [Pseudalkalibacillus decolorationis]
MRIEYLEIENFRNYKGKHKFNLHKSICILYGENGYGKSSFFDAIEWCMTGNISRFSKNESSKIDKSIIYNHLLEEDSTCSVTLSFDGRKLCRSFRKERNEYKSESVTISNESDEIIVRGQTNVENYLKKNHTGNTSEFTNRLIKQSHILSQDQITDFILRDNPKDRFKSLADIMGYKQMIYFLENIKQFSEALKKEITQHEKDIAYYDKLILNDEKDYREVDILNINKLLSELNIKVDSGDIEKQLQILSESLKKEKFELERKYKIINKLSPQKNTLYSDLISETEFLKQKISYLKARFGKAKNSIEQIELYKTETQKKIDNLTIEKQSIYEMKNLTDLIHKNEEYLSRYLSDEQRSVSYINRILSKRQNLQLRLDYINRISEEYINLLLNVEKFPKDILLKEEKLDQINHKIYKRERIINQLEGYLTIKDEDHSLLNLNKSIEAIYKYIIDNNIKKCPVCSSKNESLGSKVYNNIQANLELISQQSQTISKYIKKKDRFQKSKETLERRRDNFKNEINNIKRNLERAKKQILNIKNSSYFSNYLLRLERGKLLSLIDQCSDEIDLHMDLKNTIIEQEKLIKKQSEFSSLGIDSYEKELEQHLKKQLNHYNRYINRLNIYIDHNTEKTKETELLYEDYIKQQQLWQDLTEETTTNFDIEEHYKDVKNSIYRLNERYEKVRSATSSAKMISENEKISKKIKQNEIEKEKLLDKIKTYTDKLESLERIRTGSYERLGEKATYFLNKPNSSIQKYFSYLNPMPLTNTVIFESKQHEELEIIMSYDDRSGRNFKLSNVQYSMSSGQLNVLAISIFLAVNQAQMISKLDFVAIDDPIQNMDDVNQFSICDVLSDIKKQLLFSTHDFEFLKLFIKKNEHRRKDITVFILESDNFTVKNVKELALS